MNKLPRKVPGWQGYVTDLHDIRDRLLFHEPDHPVHYALVIVGCAMTPADEQLVRTIIETYRMEATWWSAEIPPSRNEATP